ncbi:MAG: DUF2207 domain-containing protein [Bacteroidales bacterium]|nr:DUF2207 domain-containing protein [Bacteroidales bacterium]
MRRLQAILGLFLLFLAVPSLAQSQVDTVRIDVELQDDGSAFIRERWVIDVSGDITEWYLGKENLGRMDISDFRVTDETGLEYAYEGKNWDIHRTRKEKAGKCGIVQKRDGYELCWGVGSSGPHTYIASYTLTGLVKGYSDRDGFNYMFVTPTDNARDVLLTLRKNGTILTDANTQVWGFRFHGETEVLGGAVNYWSTRPFNSNSALVAMVSFEKGIFTPSLTYDKSFEEVKEEAFKGSDYKKSEGWLLENLLQLLMVFIFIMVPFLGIGRMIAIKRRKKELLGGKMKDVAWFRDVPVGGDLREASNILRAFSGKTITENQNLIAAYMMRLFYKGAFSLVPQSGSNVAFKIGQLDLQSDSVSDMDLSLESELFEFFKEAAGNDTILQKKELRRWADRNAKRIYNWQNKIPDGKTLKTLPPSDVQEVFGLKKFLKDFTLIKDRGTVEVKLWNNYLIFASLYGIADQVYKDFKKVCPEYFTLSQQMAQMQEVTPVVIWNTFGDTSRYFNQSAINYSARHSTGTTRWSGGGGFTSFGGGGGFSGGGFSGGR